MWPFKEKKPTTQGKEVHVKTDLSSVPTTNRAVKRLARIEQAITKFQGTDVDVSDLEDEATLLRVHIKRAS